jgi:hypothetical protein
MDAKELAKVSTQMRLNSSCKNVDAKLALVRYLIIEKGIDAVAIITELKPASIHQQVEGFQRELEEIRQLEASYEAPAEVVEVVQIVESVEFVEPVEPMEVKKVESQTRSAFPLFLSPSFIVN